MEAQKFKNIDFKRVAICLDQKPTNEKEEKFLREEATYEFYNLEQPGLSVKFPYGNTKYPVKITLFHGGRYVLPRHIAMHVESKGPPIYEWRPNGNGQMEKKLVGKKPRFQMRQVM